MEALLKLSGVDFAIADFADQQRLMIGRSVRVILDAGANVGNTVAVYTDLFPEAVLFALEPYPVTYAKLLQRFEKNCRVRPVKVALGAERGAGTLFVNEYADTNSLLCRPVGRRYWAADNVSRGTVPVDIISLDRFAQEHALAHIDILKLDIQGGEGNALAGARKLLVDQRIDLIFTEIFFIPHYEGALLFHELTALLSGFGYSLYNLTHLVRGQNGQLRFGDALYVSAEIRRSVINTQPPEC